MSTRRLFDAKHKKVVASDMQLATTWRRIRDSNPGTGIAGLSHFECDLFDHLSNPPYSVLTLRNRLNFVG